MKQIEIAKKYVGMKEDPGNVFDETTVLGQALHKAGQNFVDAGFNIHVYSMPGDLVIWQRYKDGKKQWQGHAGIVTKVNPDESFNTIEGNTNAEGSREGDSVQEKHRKNTFKEDGLNVLGFITIEEE